MIGYFPLWVGSTLREVSRVGPFRIRAQVHAEGDAFVVWAEGAGGERVYLASQAWVAAQEDERIEDAIRDTVQRSSGFLADEIRRIDEARLMDKEWAL